MSAPRSSQWLSRTETRTSGFLPVLPATVFLVVCCPTDTGGGSVWRHLASVPTCAAGPRSLHSFVQELFSNSFSEPLYFAICNGLSDGTRISHRTF
uniref:Uncharacterized protein n=1 Tax=Gasterosteus aculeatus TaxID=69293 RepID=G3PNJ0_GASAC